MGLLSTLLSLLAAALFGAGDFCGGLAVRKAGLKPSLLLSQSAGALLLLAVAGLQGRGSLLPGDLPLAATAGLCAAIGLAVLYRGLATGIVAIVAPVSAVLAALVPALLGAAKGESPSPLTLSGAVLCLPAVALLSWDNGGDGSHGSLRASLLTGVVAGLFLGAFYAGISLMRSDAGLWPLFAARLMSMAAVAAFLALQALGLFRQATELSPELEEELELEEGETPSGLPISGEEVPAAEARAGACAISTAGLLAGLASGALDASGNAAFLAASSTGPLMIVSVLTSLYPALTVLLARAFFGQHLGLRQAAGLALALAGVILIGLG